MGPEVQCPAWLACESIAVSGSRFGTATLVPAGAGQWGVSVDVLTAVEAAAYASTHTTAEHVAFQSRWMALRGTHHVGILPFELELRDNQGLVLYEETFNWHLEAP